MKSFGVLYRIWKVESYGMLRVELHGGIVFNIWLLIVGVVEYEGSLLIRTYIKIKG